MKIQGMNTKAGRDAEAKYRKSKPRLVWCCDRLGPIGKRCSWCKEVRA